jgi:glycosyltransferase domain-containing protein
MKKLSIIVISYNRQEAIKKKIIFFLQNYNKSIQVFIVDGSNLRLKIDNKIRKKNIYYIHYPTEDYHKRLFYVQKFINTPFSQIQNDDDFFDPNTLIKCCNKLKQSKNIDYTSSHGKTGLISCYNEQVYIKHIFKFDKNKSYNHDDKYKRVESLFNPYAPPIYFSIMRSEVFKKILLILKYCKNKYDRKTDMFAEILISSSLILAGKSLFVNDLFWLRNDSDIKKKIELKSIKKIIEKKGYSYLNLLNYLYQLQVKKFFFNRILFTVCTILGYKKEKNYFINIVSNVFLDYFSSGIKKYSKEKKLLSIKKIFLLLLNVLPKFFKKFIRFNLKINGPSIKKICYKNEEVDYNFRKNFLIKLESLLITK